MAMAMLAAMIRAVTAILGTVRGLFQGAGQQQAQHNAGKQVAQGPARHAPHAVDGQAVQDAAQGAHNGASSGAEEAAKDYQNGIAQAQVVVFKKGDLQRQAHGDIQADAQAQNGDPAGGVTGFPEESCHGIILLNFFQRRALRMFTVKPWGAFCKYTDCRISVDSIGNRRF